jgi:hypothetical protein
MNSKVNTLLLLTLFVSCTEKIDESLKYLKQKPPSLVPEIFAPNLISKKLEYEFGSVFSNDATEFFYGVNVNGKSEIRHTKLIGEIWTEPQTILSNEKYGYNDPFLSPDEKRLYFISKMSLDKLTTKNDHDIWYVEKNKNEWSDPINAGSNINSEGNEYYISFSKEGTMYFSSNVKAPKEKGYDFDIYSSKSINGKFQKAISLGDSINTSAYEADVYIDPKESYIIFCAERQEGLGQGDLYISFKKPDGTWTESTNMGQSINSKNHELCPFVSKDGKYLFYTTNEDIYWVDAKIINEIKNKAGASM